MRGYFGLGVEGINKPMNVGNLFRSAHAFGAGFVFTVAATYEEKEGGKADTSATTGQVPFYAFPSVEALLLPKGCALVGVELTPDAVDLPSFCHPRRAAYVLGPERGSLSPAMTRRCEFVVRIPAAFCVNVGIAGAIVMYDRMIALGRYPARPLVPGGKIEPLPDHAYGGPKLRRDMEAFRAAPPKAARDPG